jgi:predicted MFS family arabinose efflux permease
VAAVVAIFLGALFGAILVTTSGLALPLALAGALVLAGTIACALHPASAHLA